MAIQAPYLYSDNFGFPTNSHLLFMEKEENENNSDHHHACGGGVAAAGFDGHQHQHQFIYQFQTRKKKKFIPNFDHLESVVTNTNTMNIDHLPPHHQSMPLSHHSLSALVEKHTLEFQHLIHLQNERLKITMQEKRKQQTSQLIQNYESKARFLLNQKQEEITKAANRTIELQDHLKRLEMESQTWRRAAKEKESMAASLTSTIQRLRESACCPSADAAGDAESACGQNTQLELQQQKTPQTLPMICRCCNSRNSCVVMLPCRHLCCCRDCEASLQSCPVCRMVKKSSIEALI